MKTLTEQLLKLAREHRVDAPDGVIDALESAICLNERDNPDFSAYEEVWKD